MPLRPTPGEGAGNARKAQESLQEDLKNRIFDIKYDGGEEKKVVVLYDSAGEQSVTPLDNEDSELVVDTRVKVGNRSGTILRVRRKKIRIYGNADRILRGFLCVVCIIYSVPLLFFVFSLSVLIGGILTVPLFVLVVVGFIVTWGLMYGTRKSLDAVDKRLKAGAMWGNKVAGNRKVNNSPSSCPKFRCIL